MEKIHFQEECVSEILTCVLLSVLCQKREHKVRFPSLCSHLKPLSGPAQSPGLLALLMEAHGASWGQYIHRLYLPVSGQMEFSPGGSSAAQTSAWLAELGTWPLDGDWDGLCPWWLGCVWNHRWLSCVNLWQVRLGYVCRRMCFPVHFCGVLSAPVRNQCSCVALGSLILKRHSQKCSLMALDGREAKSYQWFQFWLFPGYQATVTRSYFSFSNIIT